MRSKWERGEDADDVAILRAGAEPFGCEGDVFGVESGALINAFEDGTLAGGSSGEATSIAEYFPHGSLVFKLVDGGNRNATLESDARSGVGDEDYIPGEEADVLALVALQQKVIEVEGGDDTIFHV